MSLLFVLVTGVSFFSALAVLFYTIYQYDLLVPSNPKVEGSPSEKTIPERIGVRELGKIEGGLENLQRVIVMANKVDRPKDELLVAVERNFQRGVKYLFLVSHSRAPQEVNGYYQIFEALAKIALAQKERGFIHDLVEIKQLPFEWDDYPFIFYQVHDFTGRIRTIAFRGEDLHEGIAHSYTTIPSSYAHTIAKCALADGPGPIREPVRFDRERFEDVGKVVPLKSSTGKGA